MALLDGVTSLTSLDVEGNVLVEGSLTVLGGINATEAATALNTIGAGTITAAMIATSKNVIRGGAQSGAAFVDTTATAAQIVAAISGAAALDSFKFTYVNNTNAPATIVGGAGVNSAGTIAVVPAGAQIQFLVVLTSLTAVTVTVLVDGSATSFVRELITSIATIGAGTLTAAGIAGGVISRGGAQVGSPFTDTTDTAANIIAAMAGAFIGETWDFEYINTTNATATLAGGSGVTVSGITTANPGQSVRFLVSYTAANTLTIVGKSVSQAAATMQEVVLAGSTSGTAEIYAPAVAATSVATLPVGTTTLAGLAIAQTFTAAQTFNNSTVKLLGSSTGANTITALNASATNYTSSIPAVTGVLASTSGANLYVSDVTRCSASVTATSTTTFANVTGLTQIVVPGTYRFRCVLPSTVAGGTEGIKYAFNYTTAVISSIEATGIGFTAAASALQHTTTTTAQANLFSQAAVVLMTLIEGTMVVGTGGTVDLQMAQNTSGATNSVTLIGSSMEFTRIA